MKKILMLVMLCIFMIGFVFAANGIQARDTTGSQHDENIASGGMNGTPESTQQRTESQMQARANIRAGEYRIEGKPLRIQERSENKLRLQSGSVSADTELKLEEETNGESKINAKLSNGKKSPIKIMPDRASETALSRLRLRVCSEENNCTIQLKEVGQGNESRAAYEVKAEKKARIFGLFQTRMRVQSQIDAETGEVIQIKRPWWSFLASEEDEIEEDIEESSSE